MKNQKELTKILNLKKDATWAEIFVEIGRLQERASNNNVFPTYNPSTEPMPLGTGDPYPYGNPIITC